MQGIITIYMPESGFMAIIPPPTQKKKKNPQKKAFINQLPDKVKSCRTNTAASKCS